MSRCLALLFAGSVVCAAGCGDRCGPPDARGGTDVEQAAAEDEAVDFLGRMREEVCVPRIKLGTLRGTSIGRYSPGSRRIKVEKDRALGEVRSTVRHELCHALQFQQDLDLTGPEFFLALPIDVPDDERPGETWAYTCQQGPEPAFLMGDTCPGDPFGTVIFERVRAEFVRPDTVVERAVAFVEVGRVAVGEEALWFPVEGGLAVEEPGGEPSTLDLYSGQPTASGAPLDGPAEVGDARLFFYSAFAANGAQGLRLVYEDDIGATRVGCLRDRETPFAADGLLWSAYQADDELVWGQWTLP